MLHALLVATSYYSSCSQVLTYVQQDKFLRNDIRRGGILFMRAKDPYIVGAEI